MNGQVDSGSSDEEGKKPEPEVHDIEDTIPDTEQEKKLAEKMLDKTR